MNCFGNLSNFQLGGVFVVDLMGKRVYIFYPIGGILLCICVDMLCLD